MVEFKEVIADEIKKETPTTPKPAQVGGIEDFLKDYKEAPKQPESNNVFGTNIPGNSQPVISPSNPAPFGVYKSGKNAGQPRPAPKVRIGYNPSQEITSISGEILTGALFITLIDLIIPILLVGVGNRFSKPGSKIKVSDLQLTAAQKKELAPVADKVVKQLNINAKPELLLFLSLLGIYGANFAVLKFSQSNTPTNEKTTPNTSQTANQNGSTGIQGTTHR